MPPLMPGDEVWVADVRQISPGPMVGQPNGGWYVEEIRGVVAMLRREPGTFGWWTPVSNLRRTGATV